MSESSLIFLLLAHPAQQFKVGITLRFPFRFWNNGVVWKGCWFWMGKYGARSFQIWDWKLIIYLNDIISSQTQPPISFLLRTVSKIFLIQHIFPFPSPWMFSIHLHATQAFIYIIRIPETCTSWLWHLHICSFVSWSIVIWHMN